MSLAEIKEAIKHLPAKQRKQLAAHLVTLDRHSTRTFRRTLARKIDDKNPKRWVSLEDAALRLR
jgi:hypothetical protein